MVFYNFTPHTFIPKETILEIAPGCGRWTQFLATLCKNLIVVDLSEECIEHCKKRFKSYSHITYYVNDGKSLEMVPDKSIDFVFSFDSLVHAEDDVIEEYLKQMSRKLKKDGIGFIHHSNIGEYRTALSLKDWLDNKIPNGMVKYMLYRLGAFESFEYWRACSMTADKFRLYAEKYGLQCVGQEIINWGNESIKRLIDCFSIFKNNATDRFPPRVIRNNKFMAEANYVFVLSKLFAKRIN